MSKDPILFKGGQANLYVYVGNDPVNRLDPTGLADWSGGFSFEVSTINPFTSGGGGAYGVNVQYVPGQGWGVYTYGTPGDTGSSGFAPGISFTANLACGEGEWTGLFKSSSGNYGLFTAGTFNSPLEGSDLGYFGAQGGFSLGPPGVGETTTNYSHW